MIVSTVWRRIRSKKRPKRELPFPAAPHLRIAQLGKVATFNGVVAFPDECASDLESFAPQMLVAPAGALIAAAYSIFNGNLALDSVDSAVFALVPIGDAPVTPPDRDVIWRAFRVPIYELYVDCESNLLAAECEAHNGWHLRSPNVQFFIAGDELFLHRQTEPVAIRTGLTANCTDGRCACGDTAPLLRGVRKHIGERPRARAAGA